MADGRRTRCRGGETNSRSLGARIVSCFVLWALYLDVCPRFSQTTKYKVPNTKFFSMNLHHLLPEEFSQLGEGCEHIPVTFRIAPWRQAQFFSQLWIGWANVFIAALARQ